MQKEKLENEATSGGGMEVAVLSQPVNPQQSPTECLAEASECMNRGKIQDALKHLESQDPKSLSDEQFIDVQLQKSSALFELNRPEEATHILQTFGVFRRIECKASYDYTFAKLAYHDKRYDEAETYFNEITALTDKPKMKIRSLLGLANVYYSTNQHSKFPPVLANLEALRGNMNESEEICYLLLLGNYYRVTSKDKVLAKRYFKLALSKATVRSWSYFVCHGIYGLANIELDLGNAKRAGVLAELLTAMLAGLDSEVLKKIVNDRFFSKANDSSSVQVDSLNMRIRINASWFAFHDKPLLFQFFKAVHGQEKFVTKGQLAYVMWPKQPYLPRTHDPRIFDVAKRIRGILNGIGENPIKLLSGRQGYKLAKASEL